jgi:hypothetical protein
MFRLPLPQSDDVQRRTDSPTLTTARRALHGQLTQMRDFGNLLMAESHYAPGSVTPMHIHETASFIVTLSGEYMEEHRGQVFDCFPGRILFRTAGERHCDRIGSSGAHCVMLEMRPTWQPRLGATRMPSSVCQICDRQDLRLRLRRELTMVDDMTPLAAESLVLELCCQLQRARAAPRRIPPWLRQIQEKLEAEFNKSSRTAVGNSSHRAAWAPSVASIRLLTASSTEHVGMTLRIGSAFM